MKEYIVDALDDQVNLSGSELWKLDNVTGM
jgi:hypothetical protein